MTTVIAFDYGTKRIGVAVGETEVRIPHPLPVIRAEGTQAQFAAVAALLDAWRPSLCLVGLPLALDGAEHDMSRRARKFAQRLQGRFGVGVELVDERYSSTNATNDLREAGASLDEAARVVDAVAACGLLTAWFDTHDDTKARDLERHPRTS
jgi:putative holliday junction resolvase